MKVVARIHLSLRDVPREVADGLGRIFPEGLAYGSFRSELPEEDPRTRQILEFLTGHGLSPWRGLRPHTKRDFSLNLERVYSRADIESAPLLELAPSAYAEGASRDEAGLLRLRPDREILREKGGWFALTRPPGLFLACADGLVVSDRLKTAIEAAGLRHVVFRPVGATEGELPAPFWELTSDLVLPPLAKRCRFFDAIDGHEVSGDYSGPFVMREGGTFPELGYDPAECHYDAESLAAVEPFDLALGFEEYTGPNSRLRIASQAFRLFCRKQKIRVEWKPVRVDPA